jgi:SAM-dependent methyltransferase
MVADAATPPLSQFRFDVVFASTLLCLERDPKPIIDEMARLCRHGGKIVIGELNPVSPWQLWRRLKARFGAGYFRSAHWHSPRQLMRILENSGCEPTFVGLTIFGIPFARPALAGLREATDLVGAHLWPFLGAYFVVTGRKR